MNNKKYLLSIETSQKILSVALFEDRIMLTEKTCLESNSHDRLLAPYVKDMISNHLNNDYSRLNFVALSAGPGSYTGLRIGAAFVKGLCYGTDIKLIAVPTLTAIAYEAKNHIKSGQNSIITVLPSHKELYYYQKFNEDAEPISEINFEKLENIITDTTDGVLIAGILPESKMNKDYLTVQPNSVTISNLATHIIEKNLFTDLDKYEPIYVSDFVPKTSTKKLNI